MVARICWSALAFPDLLGPLLCPDVLFFVGDINHGTEAVGGGGDIAFGRVLAEET